MRSFSAADANGVAKRIDKIREVLARSLHLRTHNSETLARRSLRFVRDIYSFLVQRLAYVAHGSQFGKLPIETKTIYADCGDVNSCGDWLAVELKDAFRTDDGSFDLTAFKAFLKGKWRDRAQIRYGAPRRDPSVSHVRRFNAPTPRRRRSVTF